MLCQKIKEYENDIEKFENVFGIKLPYLSKELKKIMIS